MRMFDRRWCSALFVAALALLPGQSVWGQYTSVFTDGYAVSADTFNLNSQVAARQTGSLAPLNYVSNTPDVTNSFHHQLFSVGTSPGQPLQLAEAGDLSAPAPVFGYATMVSPNYNFKGTAAGVTVGKRITFDMNIGVSTPNPTTTYFGGGITIGGHRTLIDADNERVVGGFSDGPFFSMRFIETTCCPDPNGGNAFLQFYDNVDTVGNAIPNPAGNGTASVQIDANDPGDGDPWNGVGQTDISITINGTPVFSYTKSGGGYPDNFVTLFAKRNLFGNTLATTTVDNFLVYSAPTVAPANNSDFNDDGTVDGADFVIWQKGLGLTGQTGKTNGNANADAVVDAADLLVWTTKFGGPPAVAAVGAVPEPALAIWLAAVGAAIVAGRRRSH